MGMIRWLIGQIAGKAVPPGGIDKMSPLEAMARDMGKVLPQWPSDVPPLDEYARRVYQENLLPAAVMIPDSPDPANPLTTQLGGVGVMAEGETWPHYQDRPMLAVAQINLTECPVVPPGLEGIVLLTVFFPTEEDGRYMRIPDPGSSDINGEFVVRTYLSLEGLQPVTPPGASLYRPYSVRWQVIEDPCPHYDMVFTEFERRGYANEQARLAIDQMGKLELPGQDRWLSKVGGWPAPIQEPITVPLAFQLGGDDKSGLIWGDAGCAYFWRTQISGNELRRKLGSYMDAPPPSEWQIQVDH